jgi:hypothetical protein
MKKLHHNRRLKMKKVLYLLVPLLLVTSLFAKFDITASNKYFDFDIGASELNATVAEAEYVAGTDQTTSGSLCEALYNAIVVAEGAGTYTVSFNSVTAKFSFTRSAGTFNILWKTGTHGSDNADDHIGTIMGYIDTSDDTSALTYTSDNSATAAFVQTWKLQYDSSVEETTGFLVGDFYIGTSTNPADADAALHSDSTNPIQLYDGDLQVVTTGFGIRFADGTKQISAGVGSAQNTLTSTGTVVINSDTDASGGEPIIFQTLGATERMRILDDGNIGIGTNVPTSRLHILGSTVSDARINLLNNTFGSAVGTKASVIVKDDTGNLKIFANSDGAAGQKNIEFAIHGSGGGTVMIISTNSFVGIETTDPKSELHVEGTIEVDQRVKANDSGGLELTDDGGNYGIFIEDGGHVGIGTNAPDRILHVKGSDDTSPTDFSSVVLGDTNFGIGRIDLASPANNLDTVIWCFNGAERDIRFASKDNGDGAFGSTYYDHMIIRGDTGNVGISTGTPTEKLDVNGNVNIGGNVNIDGIFSLESINVFDYDSGDFEVDVSTTMRFQEGGLLLETTTRYLNINAAALRPEDDLIDYEFLSISSRYQLRNRSTISPGQTFYANIYLPHNAIITELLAAYYQDDGLASISVSINKYDTQGNETNVGGVGIVSTSGYATATTSGSSILIDNVNFSYVLRVILDPWDNINDVRFISLRITYTITEPLP